MGRAPSVPGSSQTYENCLGLSQYLVIYTLTKGKESHLSFSHLTKNIGFRHRTWYVVTRMRCKNRCRNRGWHTLRCLCHLAPRVGGSAGNPGCFNTAFGSLGGTAGGPRKGEGLLNDARGLDTYIREPCRLGGLAKPVKPARFRGPHPTSPTPGIW